MWNSGQTAPPAPAWGWPPNQSYQYNAHNADPNQSWAAAAALWAQQRTLQEQYSKNGAPPPANYDKPPEPPGPPPVQPHGLPPLPPLPPSDTKDVVVHDYNHGQQEPTTSTVQTVDYQHGGTASESLPSLMENDLPPVADTDVYDYNHGQAETAATDTNWQQHNYNEMQPAPVAGSWQNTDYNQDWSQQQQWHANQWNNNDGNWNQQQWNQDENQGNDYYNNPHQGGYNDNRMNKKFTTFDSIGSAGSNSPDLAEIAKKSKSLPLWLRQGLEKMEKEKKKPTEKAKDDLPNAKLVSGYQHGSPASSPERNESDNEEVEDERIKKTTRKVTTKSRSRSISPVDVKVKEVKRSNESDNEEDDELDEEEKQKLLMLKIKTWMTDILLGVTNDEVQTVCNEVYFEMKRSAKTKATQIRKSGGLEALRLASFGGEDESSSESEPEPEPKPKPMFFERQRQITSAKEDVKKFSKIIEPAIPKFVKPKATEIIDKFDSVDSKRKFTEDAHVVQRGNEQLDKREQKQDVETVKHSSRKSSSSNDEESDVESKSVSSDSGDHKRRKKSKRKRSRTRSRTPKKSRKKSSKSSHRRSTSTSDDESERRSSRKKKHKRKHYSSEDEEYSDSSLSSYRKKSSKGKKHKHRARSDSRSPSRRHSKKKR